MLYVEHNGSLQQENQEITMNTLFTQKVYIRLAEDKSAFVFTTKCGRFFSNPDTNLWTRRRQCP